MTKAALNKKAATAKSKGRASRARAKATSKVAKARSTVKKAGSAKKSKKQELEVLKKRNALIDQYMPYATSIANRVCQTLSSVVDSEEVLCNARLGLLEASKRFDVSQEVDFKTFAYYRIKGAIYDGLRRSGWLPRTLYSKIKFEEAANEYLQQRSLHNPEADKERSETYNLNQADEADKKSKSAEDTVSSLASIYIVSIDGSEDLEIEDESNDCVEKRAEFMQVRQHMRDAIGGLPEKEKQLVMMYYFQNKTMEDIGQRLGLSTSWTSRLHARALALLFKRIRQRSSK